MFYEHNSKHCVLGRIKHNRFRSQCLQQHLLCKLELICSTGRAQSWLNTLGQERTGVAAFRQIYRGIWGPKQSCLGA